MSGIARLKGQPLIVLVAVLSGWVGGRAMNWENLTASAMTEGVLREQGPRGSAGSYAPIRGLQSYQDGSYDAGPSGQVAYGSPVPSIAGQPTVMLATYPMTGSARGCDTCTAGSARMAAYAMPRSYMEMPAAEEWGESALVFAPPRNGRASRMLSRTPYPAAGTQGAVAAYGADPSVQPLAGLGPQVSVPVSAASEPASMPQAEAKPRRWSMDAWAFMRRDGNLQLAKGLLPATYGANQIGSVLRFRLLPRSRLQPTLYLRTDSTTGEGRYATVAAGASLRPLRQLPVMVALEGRLLDDSAGRHYQPAVLAVTQLPRFKLPYALEGELYAQGGWVGGRYATPFADGQVRVDHGLLTLGKFETRVGLGGWGGVQKGASRLDLGPTMSISFPLTRRVFGRASIDWRVRGMGNAAPGSGPALTLSAGF